MNRRIRLLHIAHGIPSYHQSLVAMMNRLQCANMDVHVASHMDLSSILQTAAVDFTRLTADRSNQDQLNASKESLPHKLLPIRWFWKMRHNSAYRQRSLCIDELPTLVKQWQPDVVLIDMECHVAIVQLYDKPITILLCSRWFSIFKTGGVPPMHTHLEPAAGRLQSVRIKLAWWQLRLYKQWLDWRHRWSRKRFWPIMYGTSNRFDLECLARQQGLKLNALSDRSHWLIPHVYPELPIVSFTFKELEIGLQLDRRMHYVGAMVSPQPLNNSRAHATRQQFMEFLQRNDRPASKPLVYCSFSTFWSTNTSHMQIFLDVFSRRPDWDLVIGLGGVESHLNTDELPAHILVMGYAPQLAVIQHADLVITHGGISTINESLSQGVPLLICSSGHVDQNGCKVRVVNHGVGLASSSAKLRENELESLVDQLLGHDMPSVREKAKTFQALHRRYESDDLLVQYIQQHLNANAKAGHSSA